MIDALAVTDSWPKGMTSMVMGHQCGLHIELPGEELRHPLRYLPGGTLPTLNSLPEASWGFSRICFLSKPKDWSWTEFLAAGGDLSAGQVCACIEEFHREPLSTTIPNDIISFHARCGASGCSSTSAADPRAGLYIMTNPDEEAALSRLLLAADLKMLRSSLCFPGFLLREHSLRNEIASLSKS